VLKNVKNTVEKELEKDSSSQNVNIYVIWIFKSPTIVGLF